MADLINKKLFTKARRHIPGGVNSPVRSFKTIGINPVFIGSGKGSKLFGADKRRFIDYCLSWGALILGHAHPQMVRVLSEQIRKGTSFGTATKTEIEFAIAIHQAIPSMEQVRLTNSGTEAVMGAIRLARAYTGKNKVIRFEGSYHGSADYLLNCPGIPYDFKKHALSAPYNDLLKTERHLRKYKGDIAAVIVEPVAANMGVVLPQDGFLPGLRRLCDKYETVLIFDEVITGFRLLYGGAQKIFDIKPDLTCLGKIIGGGLPMGAFGGKRRIMQLLAPEGNVYQAGTFSGNPLSVTAGLATLNILRQNKPYKKINELTSRLCKGIEREAQDYGIPIKINGIGSMFTIFFSCKKVYDYSTSKLQDSNLFRIFYRELLKKGVYLSPSGFEANFLSSAHALTDIEMTLRASSDALKSIT